MAYERETSTKGESYHSLRWGGDHDRRLASSAGGMGEGGAEQQEWGGKKTTLKGDGLAWKISKR